MNLSKEQGLVLNSSNTTKKNLAISSVAGSGKTTTILEIVKAFYAKAENINSKIIIVMFNKALQIETLNKLKKIFKDNQSILNNIRVTTMHGYCYGLMQSILPEGESFELNDNYPYGFFSGYLKVHNKKFPAPMAGETVAAYKNMQALGINWMKKDTPDYTRYVNQFGNNVPIFAVNHIMSQIYTNNPKDSYIYKKRKITNSDMLYFVYRYWKYFKFDRFANYDLCIFDEIQDFSSVMFDIAKNLIIKDKRFIGVGDPNQRIMDFAGTDPQSFNNFLKLDNTEHLKLSVTFRCYSNIVNYVRNIFPNIDINYHESNIGGTITDSRYNDLIEYVDNIQDNSMVISRRNKELYPIFVELLIRGKKAQIKSESKLDQRLIKSIEKSKIDSINELIPYYDTLLFNERASILRHYNLPNLTAKELERFDSYQSIVNDRKLIDYIIRKFNPLNMDGLKDKIVDIFKIDDDENKILLTTAHASKGLEVNDENSILYIVNPNIFTKFIQKNKGTNREVEEYLYYVALTRAKQHIVNVYLPENVDENDKDI